MHLPAEIAPYLTPENLKHLGDGLERYFESKIGGAIAGRLFKAARRKLLPFLDRFDDIELIKRRLDGLEDFAAGFQAENSRPAQNELEEREIQRGVEQNINDPAFDAFVAEAVEAAMQSPDEAMRLLLGRITALRSYAPTSNAYALQLQEALTLTKRLSVRQLWALTTVYMLTSRAFAPVKMPLPQIQAYLDREYFPVLEDLANRPWSAADLQHLDFLNLVSRQQTYEMMERSPGSRFRRVFRAGGEYWPVPQGEPIGGAFLDLADAFDSEEGHNRRSIGPYNITPIGGTLGRIVFGQLYDQLVRETH